MAAWLSCAAADESGGDVSGRYPAGSIGSLEQADAALADAARERAGIEARFAAEERACHVKFFATPCVDQAKERRREALAQVRKVELEANAFKRRERVAERENEAAERRAKDEAERLERMRERQEDKADARADTANPPPRAGAGEDRQARHDAKLQAIEESERADAQKRAENAADYERKVKAAQERQKKVAQRKAEQEEKRRAKHAAEAGAQ